MRGAPLLLAVILILSITGYATQQVEVAAQPSEEEARNIFEQIGCTACHTGNPLQPAASWDLIVQFMEEWSQKYPSIDEAIRNEVVYYGNQRFNSFDELMERMSSNVGKTRNDPEIQQLEAFFRSFWGEQPEAPAQEAPAQEEQQEEAPAQQEVQPAEEQPAVRGGEEPRVGITLTIVSIALIILITIVAAVYLTRR